MPVSYQDSIIQSPWYVRAASSEKYFNKHVKSKAEKLDELIQKDAEVTLDQLWEQFRKKPSTLPVFTKDQLDKMVAKPNLSSQDKLVLHRYLAKNPRVFFLSSELLQKANESAVEISNSVQKFVARVSKFIKKKQAIFTFQLQSAHKYVADNHWNLINPRNSFIYLWFSWIGFVKRRAETKEQKLINLSPYYRAKIEGLTSIEVQIEYPGYCARFGIGPTVVVTKAVEKITFSKSTAFKDTEEESVVKSTSLLKPVSTTKVRKNTEVVKTPAVVVKTTMMVEQEPVVKITPAPKPPKVVQTINAAVSDASVQPNKVTPVSDSPIPPASVAQTIEPEEPKQAAKIVQKLQQPKKIEENKPNRVVYKPKTKTFEWDHSKKSLTKFAKEVLTKENNNVRGQFERDVDLTVKTLQSPESPGSDEFHGKLSASVLKKLFFAFNATDPMYRRDKMWHRFSGSDIPLAALLGHSTRTLIQLPPIDKDGKDHAHDFFVKFLGIGIEHKRAAATHGVLIMPRHEFVNDGIYKHVHEIKPGMVESGTNIIYDYFNPNSLEGHYGINLAYGGAGEKHFLSGKTIDNKGEHGHLYIYFKPATKTTPGAILVGIEGSAPADKAAADVQNFAGSVYDHVGGGHDILGTPNRFCVSGGEKMGKSAQSLGGRGPDEYYDSMFVHLSIEQCQLIQQQFNEENFDYQMLQSQPVGNEKERGHDAMDELFKAHPVDCTADQSKLWAYYNYLLSTAEQNDDNVFNVQWHLDIVDGKKLHGVSSIDEGYQKAIIQDAIKALSGYLKLTDKEVENKQQIEKLIADLAKVSSWKDMVAFLYRLEMITVHTGEKAHLIGEFIINKPGAQVLPAENVTNSIVANSPNDPIINSILGGVSEMVFEYNHFQKFVIQAHQTLIQLIPQEHHQLSTDTVNDISEIKQWQQSVMTIEPGQENKAIRDFTRDFAINGIDGKKRIENIQAAHQDDVLEAADKEKLLKTDITQSVDSVIDILDPGFDAKEQFILSSGGQDMTRFVEELVFHHLEIDSMPQNLRIATSEQHGNWYLDENHNTCFNAKIYVTSFVDPTTLKSVVKLGDKIQMVDSSELLSKKMKENQLPKLLEVDVQIKLTSAKVEGNQYRAVPIVEICTFNFYDAKINLDKSLEKDIANDFVLMN